MTAAVSFAALDLDADVFYPVPNGRGQAVLKTPAEMNRHDRRVVLRVVERCAKDGVPHPYRGRPWRATNEVVASLRSSSS